MFRISLPMRQLLLFANAIITTTYSSRADQGLNACIEPRWKQIILPFSNSLFLLCETERYLNTVDEHTGQILSKEQDSKTKIMIRTNSDKI